MENIVISLSYIFMAHMVWLEINQSVSSWVTIMLDFVLLAEIINYFFMNRIESYWERKKNPKLQDQSCEYNCRVNF